MYEEFTEWCEQRNEELGLDIKIGKAQASHLEAAIEKKGDDKTALSARIEKLSETIASNEADLADAAKVRKVDAASFADESKELQQVISTLKRAISILEQANSKGGASMVQLKNARSLAEALDVMVQASLFSTADAQRLTTLLQSDDDSSGDAAPSIYENSSGNIIDLLERLFEEAENRLEAARKKETKAITNFKLLKQSIDDEIKYATSDMNAAKETLSKRDEDKATSKGDLAVTKKALAEDLKALDELHHGCMEQSEDFQLETKTRSEEMSALATAKKVVLEMTGGAEKQIYDKETTFLQIHHTRLTSDADLANFEAVRFVRTLAIKSNSTELAQLASKMAAAMELGGPDPMAKVGVLIKDMITKLEKDAVNELSEKEYCDKELSETKENKEGKTQLLEKLSTKLAQMVSRSSKMKEEIADIQGALSKLIASQVEMDRLRQEEKALFLKSKAELENGVKGVQLALKVLRKYYAKEKEDAGPQESSGSIIGLLEVIESDFTKGLTELVAAETAAQSGYEAESQDNEETKAVKQQEVEFKTKELAANEKAVTAAKQDSSSTQDELDAVLEYLKKIEGKCIVPPASYQERKARREAMIAGLKEALSILSQTSLLQSAGRKGLRGVRLHRHS